jgi:hypothetical protein
MVTPVYEQTACLRAGRSNRPENVLVFVEATAETQIPQR